MIDRVCEYCGVGFKARNYQVKIGTGRFCSRSCFMKSTHVPVENRFWDKIIVKKSNECWEWIAYKNPDGYGVIGIKGGKTERAHRVSYKIHFGKIPKGMVVMHKCDNPGCCNPNHLMLGTQAENIYDMISKGRLVNKKGEKHGSSRLTQKQVDLIRSEYNGRKGEKIELSRRFNVRPTTITNILTYKNWK